MQYNTKQNDTIQHNKQKKNTTKQKPKYSIKLDVSFTCGAETRGRRGLYLFLIPQGLA